MGSIQANATHLLLDIEGTTSSIRFVTETMFPFVRQQIDDFIDAKRNDASALLVFDQVREEARRLGFTSDPQAEPAVELRSSVLYLMDRDAKVTGLKKLQGMIWEAGFLSGTLVAHVYPEVPDMLRRWKASGKDLRIYSSGSIAAQQLFFGHTIAGNLLPLFSAHYDTTIGGKKEVESYRRIIDDIQQPPHNVLFISDSVEELDAAAAAGLQVLLSRRDENPTPPPHRFPEIRSFEEIDLT